MLLQGVDLVVLEYSTNDFHNLDSMGITHSTVRQFEQLLRKALDHPNESAVLVLEHYAWCRARAAFWRSAETSHVLVVQCYDFPVLSLRNTANHLMQSGVGGFR